MGLLPPEEVKPVRLLNIISLANGKVTASETIITIEQLIVKECPRIPAYTDAQKDFTMAFVIIMHEVPTPAEAAFFSSMVSYFCSDKPWDGYVVPFYDATGGRGTMTATLPEVPSTQVIAGVWAFSKPDDPQTDPPAYPPTPTGSPTIPVDAGPTHPETPPPTI